MRPSLSQAARRAGGRRVARIGLVTGALVLVWAALGLLLPSDTAFAHANLARASPAPNSVLDEAPSRVAIWFTEPIEPSLSEIQVLDAQGSRVDDGDSLVDTNDPLAMSVGLGPIAEGTYTVAWKNVSTVDGHRVRGSFVFSVGEPIAGASVETPGEPLLQSPAEPFVRWVVLVSVLAMVGGLTFDLLVSRPVLLSRRAEPSVRRVGAALASRSLRVMLLAVGLFIAASAVQLIVNAAEAHEVSPLRTLGSPLQSILGDTEWGRLWLWRIGLSLAFLATLAVLLFESMRVRSEEETERWAVGARLLALGIGGGILVTLSLTSHGAATTGIRSAALFSDYLHLSASAFWVGALFHFALGVPLVLRSLPPGQRRACLAGLAPRFSTVAALSVAVLIVTGIFGAWAQVTVAPALATPYGLTLVVKVVLVALLLAVGALNLLWVRPGLAEGTDRGRWLKRLVAGEAALGIVVLASVGVLTSLEPARQVAARDGIGVSDSLTFQDTAEGAAITLEVEPATVGPNTFTVSLEDRLGNPIATASDVSLRLAYLDADLGEETASAVSMGDGTYVLSQSMLSIAGAWQVELIVRRPDAFDARTAFRFEALAVGAGGSASIAPSPETANLLLGAGLIVLGMLFMGLALPLGGWYTRTGAGVMVPGIAGFLAGLVLLLNTQLAQPDDQALLRNPFPPDPASLQTGGSVYERSCQTCHGAFGRGDGPGGAGLDPPPADLVVHVPLHSERDLFRFVHDGVPGTSMAPLGDRLTDEDIWHVINYIRTFEE